MVIVQERISCEDLNTLIDKSTRISILNCDIKGKDYISNLNTQVNLQGCRLEGTTLVLLDNDKNRIMDCFNYKGGARLVNIVSGYAYTHQVSCNKSFGVSCHG